MRTLKQWGENTWTMEQDLKLLGLELGARGTLCRFENSDLCLYSPVQLSPKLQKAINDLGTLKWVIAPNLFHHLFLPSYVDAFPGARYVGPSGLLKKRPELRLDQHFDQEPLEFGQKPSLTAPVSLVIEGVSSQEIVLVYDGSLIVADLVFNIQHPRSVWEKIFWVITGNYQKVAPSRFFKTLVRDEKALRDSLDKLLKLPFDRILLSHGEVVPANAKSHLREAFEWILS